MVNIKRIDDSSYLYKFTDKENKKYRVVISLPEKLGSPAFRYILAKKAAENIDCASIKTFEGDENTNTLKFEVAKQKWVFKKGAMVDWKFKIGSKMTRFIHEHGESHCVYLDISQKKSKKKSNKISQNEVLGLSLSDMYASNTNAAFQINPAEYVQGIVAKKDLKGMYEIKNPEFNNPYTELSALAFQKYEKNFNAKDNFSPEDCEYFLAKDKDQLVLVHKDNAAFNTPENNRKTIDTYINFLEKEYGKEKTQYIQHLFKLDLAKAERLTPEHVYRMNIGMTILESQDINTLLKKMKNFDNWIKENPQDLNKHLSEVYQESITFGEFTGKELRGIYRFLQEEFPGKSITVGDMKSWIDSLALQHDCSEELSSEQFNLLVNMTRASAHEAKLALTGRKIWDYLHSGYTTAGHNEYKPWIDQQELLQIMVDLEGSASPEEYHEKLAHVVVKAQLLREHPVEGYRLGTLIPVYNGSGGPKWYKVTSCCNNRHGIFYYTLEGASQSFGLPPIILFRSTASAFYSMHPKSSVLNDINLLNSPGYEGMNRADVYGKAFFHERTLPVWAGYLCLVQNRLEHKQDLTVRDLVLLYKDLKDASNELEEHIKFKNRYKSMKEVLRENDAVLNNLLLRNESLLGIFDTTLIGNHFLEIFKNLKERYVEGESSLPTSKEELKRQQSDALALIEELEKFPSANLPSEDQEGIRVLIRALRENILCTQDPKTEECEFMLGLGRHLLALEEQVKNDLKLKKFDNALIKMRQWSTILSDYAQEQGEDMRQKKADDLIFTGHSLGGACAQSHLAHYTAEQNRIPLPGKQCTGFFFDDPAINHDSNESFKKFGFRHRKLFKRLRIQFTINRFQEAGDIVPFGGEVHLGAAYSKEEMQALQEWLVLNAFIHERLPHAKHHTIARSKTAHATRFLGGVAASRHDSEEKIQAADYIKTPFNSYFQGVFDKRGRLPSETISSKELYDHIHREYWKIDPALHEYLSNDLRTSPHNLLILLRKVIKNSENTRGDEFLDRRGVLYVSEKQGVESLVA